jgi:hypothetical protein
MSALANAYDQALYGEPISVVIRRKVLNTDKAIWTIGDWTIDIPEIVPRRAPETQRMVADLKAWTGLSSRQLARMLGTSHPTIRRLESGRDLVPGHSGDLGQRLLATHDVVARVATIANYEQATVKDALEFEAKPGFSAVQALQAREPSLALLRALDRLRPRPEGLIRGTGSRRSGATTALHE